MKYDIVYRVAENNGMLSINLFSFYRYKNIPQMSFDDTGREPEQAFRLNRDPTAELEYPTK